MAPEKSANRPGDTTNQPMLFNGSMSVFRASGSEPTGRRQPWRHHKFIDTQGLQAKCLPDNCTCSHLCAPRRVSNSERNSQNFFWIAERRGFTTKSKPAGISARDVRRISLTLLLARFLSWALPNLRGVVRPKRLCSSPFSNANRTKERETFFAPLSYTAWNSSAFRSFKPFGNTVDLPTSMYRSTQ